MLFSEATAQQYICAVHVCSTFLPVQPCADSLLPPGRVAPPEGGPETLSPPAALQGAVAELRGWSQWSGGGAVAGPGVWHGCRWASLPHPRRRLHRQRRGTHAPYWAAVLAWERGKAVGVRPEGRRMGEASCCHRGLRGPSGTLPPLAGSVTQVPPTAGSGIQETAATGSGIRSPRPPELT